MSNPGASTSRNPGPDFIATISRETTTVTIESGISPSDAVDLNNISETDARRLMSKEHKALGHRPPPGSLAAQAQASAARHPQGTGGRADSDVLTLAALTDAERINQQGRIGSPKSIDLSTIGEEEARKIMSIEHRALGYNPPRGSLAAEA
ncbi:hypothetical protein BJ138DRAFT_1127252 [Hygrophoropsis aurantiaca]|uniref:Uncharacterized protein n=1 Tax=Hygrophoropsis aurantiaca TaxID=72124 RepID=A0ACB8AAB9_9AGAM|nr:hypothetical protein BJ138DRAFT_1127252 [Hygrophoropsis aurantiaca]